MDRHHDLLIKSLTELCPSASSENIYIFARLFEPRSYRKGSVISEEGVLAKEVFFVNKGCVRLHYLNNGEEVTANFLFEGNYGGPCKSMVTRKANRQVFTALEDCELLMLPNTVLGDALKDVPALAHLRSSIAEQILFGQEDIIAFFLSYSPEERYIHLLEHHPQLLQRVPQHFIASMIGVSAVSLSRIRKRITGRSIS